MSRPRARLPKRDRCLWAKVEQRTYEAVEAFAAANGYTLSAAVNRVLVDWAATHPKGRAKAPAKR